jgi:hypothetical protein
MAPPAQGPVNSAPATDLFPPDEGEAAPATAAPAAPPASSPSSVTVTPEIQVVAGASSTAPNTAQATDDPEAEKKGRSFSDRLSVIVGGGYTILQPAVRPEAEPFKSAAPTYRGLSFYGQIGYGFLGDSAFDLRGGGEFSVSPLSLAPEPGTPESSVTAISLAAYVEANVAFDPKKFVGLGLSLAGGYRGLESTDADVGAPYSATLDFGSEGGLHLGGKLFLNLWKNNFRLGLALDHMATSFALATGAGNPDLRVQMEPHLYGFLGADVWGIIRDASADSKDKKKSK